VVDTERKLSQFEDRVRREAANIFSEASLAINEKRKYLLKIRLELGERTFIDIFYNPKNDRSDLALIHNSQRIFGYDNLGGWHHHPAEEAKSHIPCDEPSIGQVFQEMKSLVLTLTDNPGDHF
jgi:hypothetical protein